MVKTRPRDRAGIAAVAVLGLLAIAQHWFDERRPPAPESRAVREFVVTSGDDSGEGSLREAIFAAAGVEGRARIVLRTPRIHLRSALPPLVNASGVSIESEVACEVDASAVGNLPALEVQGPHSQLAGVALLNAPFVALRVAATDFRLARVRIAGNGIGVLAAPGAERLAIEGSRFEANLTGIRLEAAARGVAIRDNHFAAHREAAIWLVRPEDAVLIAAETVAVAGNRFEADRISVVMANAPVAIERNEFIGAGEAAILMLGGGGQVRFNRVRDGRGIGILAQGAPRSTIEGNEVSRNRALGVLVRYSGATTVQDNRIYSNGYGMAFVLGESGNPVLVHDNAVMSQQYDGIVVIGDSPVISRNRTMNNGQAGMRLFDLALRDSPKVFSIPYLEANTLAGNLLNEIVRGEYRIDAETASK